MLVNAESVLTSRKQLKDVNVERWLGWRKLKKSAHDREDGTGYKAGHFHKPGLLHTRSLGCLWAPCRNCTAGRKSIALMIPQDSRLAQHVAVRRSAFYLGLTVFVWLIAQDGKRRKTMRRRAEARRRLNLRRTDKSKGLLTRVHTVFF
jgi:hypothetical protein